MRPSDAWPKRSQSSNADDTESNPSRVTSVNEPVPALVDADLVRGVRKWCPRAWVGLHVDANLRFARVLRQQIAEVGFVRPAGRAVHLLDLGCGDCRWLPALKAVFGSETRIYGIEQNQADPKEARAAFGKPKRSQLELRQGDATD